jgi:hypothetical protein
MRAIRMAGLMSLFQQPVNLTTLFLQTLRRIMVLTHISKDPSNKTPISGKIQIFLLVLTLRWKQDQGMFELNGKPHKVL